MKFKIDENLPVETAVLLNESGHDALTVLDQTLSGQPDQQIADICQDEKRVILTLDLDFADIRAYPPDEFSGIIVLRLKYQSRSHVLATVRRLISLFELEEVHKKLWIVDEERIRIRD